MRRRWIAVIVIPVVGGVALADGQRRYDLIDKAPRGVELIAGEVVLGNASDQLVGAVRLLPGVVSADAVTESYREDGRTTVALTVDIDSAATLSERDEVVRIAVAALGLPPFEQAWPRFLLTRGEEVLADVDGHVLDLHDLMNRLGYLHDVEQATGVAIGIRASYIINGVSIVHSAYAADDDVRMTRAFLASFDKFLGVEDTTDTDWWWMMPGLSIHGTPMPEFAAFAMAAEARVPFRETDDSGTMLMAGWDILDDGREAPSLYLSTQVPGIPRPELAALAEVVATAGFPTVLIDGRGGDENGRATIGDCVVPSDSITVMDPLVVDALLAPGVLDPARVRAGLCDQRR